MTDSTAEQAIAEASVSLDRALVDGDPAQVAAHFTEDAVLGESGMEDLVGRSVIEAFLAKANEVRTVTGHRLTRDLIDVTGDRAVEWGRFVETKAVSGRPPIEERGRTATLWRRQADGRWRIARLIISDLPAGH